MISFAEMAEVDLCPETPSTTPVTGAEHHILFSSLPVLGLDKACKEQFPNLPPEYSALLLILISINHHLTRAVNLAHQKITEVPSRPQNETEANSVPTPNDVDYLEPYKAAHLETLEARIKLDEIRTSHLQKKSKQSLTRARGFERLAKDRWVALMGEQVRIAALEADLKWAEKQHAFWEKLAKERFSEIINKMVKIRMLDDKLEKVEEDLKVAEKVSEEQHKRLVEKVADCWKLQNELRRTEDLLKKAEKRSASLDNKLTASEKKLTRAEQTSEKRLDALANKDLELINTRKNLEKCDERRKVAEKMSSQRFSELVAASTYVTASERMLHNNRMELQRKETEISFRDAEIQRHLLVNGIQGRQIRHLNSRVRMCEMAQQAAERKEPRDPTVSIEAFFWTMLYILLGMSLYGVLGFCKTKR